MNPIIIAVSGILAVFLTAMASFMLLPIEDDFYKTNQNSTIQKVVDISQSMHSIYVVMPPLFVGGIFMASFMRAMRKTSEEDWDA